MWKRFDSKISFASKFEQLVLDMSPHAYQRLWQQLIEKNCNYPDPMSLKIKLKIFDTISEFGLCMYPMALQYECHLNILNEI